MEASARAPEDLYGLPLEEFTPARDALAKELKAAGRKDEATEVKSLRKPSVAAWAMNRVARDHADAIGPLRAAGADLRAAQQEAMSGDAGRLRDAGRALAEEVDRVAALAADVLKAAGRAATPAQQEKVVATLRTAAVDDEAGDALARGVLVEELESTGFSLLGAGAGTAAPARPAKKSKAPKEALEAVEAARRELRRCDAEADTAATRARRRAERAETAAKRAAEAQREAEQARAEAEEAAGEAEVARRSAAEAADRLAAAEAALPS